MTHSAMSASFPPIHQTRTAQPSQPGVPKPGAGGPPGPVPVSRLPGSIRIPVFQERIADRRRLAPVNEPAFVNGPAFVNEPALVNEPANLR